MYICKTVILLLWLISATCHSQGLYFQKDDDKGSLILTHVLFRHGNRTGEKGELYPKDPYLNESYFPIGNGQLTNEGKRKEYSIGEALRQTYNQFLGDYYYPDIIDCYSTNYNRTKMSLQLVLASLFPPRRSQIWSYLEWQPVPYNYLPANSDRVLQGTTCPTYKNELKKLRTSPKWQNQFNKYKEIFNYISENTGLNVTTYNEVYDLYFGLSTEEEYGFPLPPWTKKVWPKIITELAVRNYYYLIDRTNMKRLAVGYFLKKVLDDTKEKIKKIKKPNGRKMYLYSAHENNVAFLLITLDIFKPPHVPTYGSYVVLEVHLIDGVYGIKIYYENYTTSRFQLLKLPACDEFCPLAKFENLVKEYLPTDDLCGNVKSK